MESSVCITKESDTVISKILDSIINDFYDYSEIKQNDLSKSSDVSTKIKEKVILDSFNQEVLFITVSEQHSGELCGFHALFNLYTMTRFLVASINSEKSFIYSELTKPLRFYKFHRETINLLLTHKLISKEDFDDLIKYHGLEREVLSLLLTHNSIYSYLHSDPFVYETIFFSMENIQVESYHDILSIQLNIDNFKNNEQKKYLALILGVVNHWSSLIIEKQLNNTYKFYYLDSIGVNPFMFNSTNEILGKVDLISQHSKNKGYKEISKFHKEMFSFWFVDLKVLFNLISKCLNSDYQLIEFLIEQNFNRFFNSLLKENFYKENESELDKINSWILDRCHPMVVRNDTLTLIYDINYDFSKLKVKNEFKNKLMKSISIKNSIYNEYLKESNKEKYCLIIDLVDLIEEMEQLDKLIN